MTKYNDERIEEARQLRLEGKSYGEISKATGIPKSSLVPLIRDIQGPASESKKGDGLPASMGPAAKVELSPGNVDLANQVREIQLRNQKLQADIESRALRRRLELEQREENLELTRRAIEIQREEAAMLATQSQVGQDSGGQGEANQKYLEALERIRGLEVQLEQEKASVVEERRRAEIDSLKDQVAALSAQIAGQQTGRTQYDLLSQGMSLLGQEIGELRRGAFDLINSPNIRAKFSPGRVPTDLRRQQGEVIAGALEGERLQRLRCPGCGAEAPVTEKMLAEFPKFACRQCGTVFPNPRRPAPAPREKPSKTGETKEGKL